jgi:DNA polymerase-3 subunit beta
MKATCHREGLLAACQLVSVAVPARDVKPVLRNIKAVVGDDRCTLMATDTEVGVRMEVRGVKAEEPGEALLPAARLVSILRESTDEEIVIEAGPDASTLRGQLNEFEMPGEDPSAFPDFPDFAEDKYHEITAGVLREMIRRTLFSVATEATRYGATTGVLWELDGDRARLVATDGRRLALADGAAQSATGHSTKGQMPVVPVKAMTLLERNLQEPDELVRVCFRPNESLMKTERAMIYSRLVEGRFPNYKQVIPQKHTYKIALTVGPFHTAVRQAAIMTDEESKRVVFSFARNKLTLQARGMASGRSKVEMPLAYEGKAVEIAFDPKFLSDMLRVLDPEAQLSLEMVDGNSPALFKTEAGDYAYVIVPLVVRDEK